MNLRSIKYSDTEKPVHLSVTMSIKEAAFLVKIFGGMNSHQSNAVIQGGDVMGDEIWSCLVNVFNRHWDDGIDGYLAGGDND